MSNQFNRFNRLNRSLPRFHSLPWHKWHGSNTFPYPPFARRCWYYSSMPSSHVDFDAIQAEMLSRPPKYVWDAMSPTNSHLLNIALADFIPPDCQPAHFINAGVIHPAGRPYDQIGLLNKQYASDQQRLPEGHHLVYFPPQIRTSDLLPDGTDPFHSPGSPFVRRMWAGGSIEFGSGLRLDSSPALCIESIEQVSVKGPAGEEKIFVDVLRRYMDEVQFRQNDEVLGKDDARASENRGGPIERRTIVFMHHRDPEDIKTDMIQASENRSRVIKGRLSKFLTSSHTALFLDNGSSRCCC